ncbi:hypothetical protein [Nocardioides psychrotolerans]|uniref:Uncharacterized protein n=1 Tax=Nocardioides psychrotolerans TaxID=1005945 RepID=A0A1I3RIG3_9ACTN|nr:hypothetical protein [Nocardioides psychrotolerans]SFJ46353.1 hypothetical protein SAMN05216561_13313 [Nocardioides psychrotolerans]
MQLLGLGRRVRTERGPAAGQEPVPLAAHLLEGVDDVHPGVDQDQPLAVADQALGAEGATDLAGPGTRPMTS